LLAILAAVQISCFIGCLMRTQITAPAKPARPASLLLSELFLSPRASAANYPRSYPRLSIQKNAHLGVTQFDRDPLRDVTC
jgi:hypothetical protein